MSDHLIDIHNFRLPPGHTRFRYQEDENGVYHLQTVRFESTNLSHEGEVSRDSRNVLTLTGTEVETCRAQEVSPQSSDQLVLLHRLIMSDGQEAEGNVYLNKSTSSNPRFGVISIAHSSNPYFSLREDIPSDKEIENTINKASSTKITHLEDYADPRNLQLLSETCCSLAHLPGQEDEDSR